MALMVAMSTHAEVEMNEHERRDYATRSGLANRRGALKRAQAGLHPALSTARGFRLI
jgi:hypothetical protein